MRDFGNGFLNSKLSMGYNASDILLFLENNYKDKDNDPMFSLEISFNKEVGVAENYEGLVSVTVTDWHSCDEDDQAIKEYNCDTIYEIIDWFEDDVQRPLIIGDWEFRPSMYKNCVRVVNKKYNIDETFDVPKWTQYSKRVARHIEMFLTMYQYEHCNK